MTATRTHPPVPLPVASAPRRSGIATGRPHPPASDNSERRNLLDQASRLHEQARSSAEVGDIAGSAQTILKALNFERRAGGLGPQVLQLIKPR
jgi:hypothetical protein